MKVSYPSYYDKFRCIAAACPDSCCKEWTVDVDEHTAAHYRQLPGDFGKRLRKVLVDTEDGTVMQIEDNRCPMWQQDGLCRIQSELGHDALCKTCREFPRLRHEFGDFEELGLELSCPEAARLILTADDHSTVTTTIPGGEDPQYDTQVMHILITSRQEALALLDNRHYCLPEKLAILLLYAHAVQGQIDGADEIPFAPDTCLILAKKHTSAGNMQLCFSFFRGLEMLTAQWQKRLDNAPVEIAWGSVLQEFARYLIGRYWLQAISDYDLICRVKLIIVSCLLVGALGGDPIQTAQLFSKEIENDAENIEAILDGAYTSPALTDTNLLSLLLPQKLCHKN